MIILNQYLLLHIVDQVKKINSYWLAIIVLNHNEVDLFSLKPYCFSFIMLSLSINKTNLSLNIFSDIFTLTKCPRTKELLDSYLFELYLLTMRHLLTCLPWLHVSGWDLVQKWAKNHQTDPKPVKNMLTNPKQSLPENLELNSPIGRETTQSDNVRSPSSEEYYKNMLNIKSIILFLFIRVGF